MKALRSGYTTGACAAAAAKAAVQILLGNEERRTVSAKIVEIPFPDGRRVAFRIYRSGYKPADRTAFASVIKDAGDDPDVTNGAEIIAEAKIEPETAGSKKREVIIMGGKGIGIVTKPGLAVSVGGCAINPVPRKMIFKAVSEALSEHHSSSSVEVTIEMPDGEELAKKTLNSRLGILGGLSILGTTGIVTPVSAESWKATISSSLDVAKAMHRKEVVLSAGRTSEKAHIREYGFPEECYVMMGDYFEYSLKEAGGRGFDMIYVCAQWAKMLKIAMATPQTHVRHGAIDLERTVEILNLLGVRIPKNKKFNTAREIFDMISARADKADVLDKVQEAVKIYAKSIVSGNVHIKVSLVSYDGQILMGDR